MKTLLMSLILSVLAGPLLANQPASQPGHPYEYLKTYDHYRRGYYPDSDQMMGLLNNCMPVYPVTNGQPLQRKLLQIVDDDKRIITVRT